MEDPRDDNRAVKIRSTEEINSAIQDLKKKSSRIKIAGLSGQDSLAVGIEGNVELRLNGNVGKYFGSLNDGSVITLKGNTSSFTGDNMIDGGIIIFGNTGPDAGINMRGGILVIKGSCKDGLGRLVVQKNTKIGKRSMVSRWVSGG